MDDGILAGNSLMDPMQFLDVLDSSLSEAELSALCRQFGVAFGAFPGATRREKTREFLGYIQRKGRMAGLAEATTALRPDLIPAVALLFEGKEQDLAWIDELVVDDDRGMESGLTWRWPSSTSAGKAPQEMPSARTSAPLSAMSNPYTPGRMVTEKAMFFGRAAEREQLQRYISGGENVAIIGGRGFGGSSLLYHMARSFDDAPQQLSAYVDLKDPAHQTLPGLLNLIWRQWWGRVRPGKAPHIRIMPEFVTAVRKLNAAGYRPLLFLDELEQLVWRPSLFGDSFLDVWRELIDGGQFGLTLTSHASPADLLAQNGYSSSFYTSLQSINLGLLTQIAASDVLAVPLQRAGFDVSGEIVDYFVDKAGPHPFFLQIAGRYLFDSLAERSYTRSEVDRLFTLAAEPFWQELWDSMTPLAQEYYPTNSSMIFEGMAGRQWRIIANKGLAIADEEGIRPFSSGFADWLGRMRAAVEAAEAVVAA